jgi:hypothetical protein
MIITVRAAAAQQQVRRAQSDASGKARAARRSVFIHDAASGERTPRVQVRMQFRWRNAFDSSMNDESSVLIAWPDHLTIAV